MNFHRKDDILGVDFIA